MPRLEDTMGDITDKNCKGRSTIISFSYKVCHTTLEYLITVQHLLNVHNGKLDFTWLAKKDNFMLLN